MKNIVISQFLTLGLVLSTSQAFAQTQIPVRPDDIRDGVAQVIDPKLIEDLSQWAKTSKATLEAGQKKIANLQRADRLLAYQRLINEVVRTSDDLNTELLMRSVLRRARNIAAIIDQGTQNPNGDTFKLRLYRTSVEWAIKLYQADTDFLNGLKANPTKVKLGDMDFFSLGLDHAKLILDLVWLSPDLNTEARILRESLGYFFNDLNRDLTARRNPDVAQTLFKIAEFVKENDLENPDQQVDRTQTRKTKVFFAEIIKDLGAVTQVTRDSQPTTKISPMIEAGSHHTCALSDQGQVQCWGSDSDKQVSGHKNLNLGKTVQIAANLFHTCALSDQGQVQCWGYDFHSQTSGHKHLNLDKAVQIAAGQQHTCALSGQGQVQCWGYDGYKQASGHKNLNLGKTVQIAAGAFHTCAISDQGQVHCWGSDDSNEVSGHKKLNLGKTVQITASGAHTCALSDQGQVQCWGEDKYGQVSGHNNLNLKQSR